MTFLIAVNRATVLYARTSHATGSDRAVGKMPLLQYSPEDAWEKLREEPSD